MECVAEVAPGQIVSARVRAYAKHRFSTRQAHKKSKTADAPPPDMTIDSRKLTRFAKALRGRRIGVAGDFMLDRYVWGSATRLSPEAPVPVVDFVNESQVLGGAGNVATKSCRARRHGVSVWRGRRR